jgi:hypothetical protein
MQITLSMQAPQGGMFHPRAFDRCIGRSYPLPPDDQRAILICAIVEGNGESVALIFDADHPMLFDSSPQPIEPGSEPEGLVTPMRLSDAEVEHLRARFRDIPPGRAGQVTVLPPAPRVSEADLDTLLAVARLYVDAFHPDETMTLPERLALQGVEDVLARLDAR